MREITIVLSEDAIQELADLKMKALPPWEHKTRDDIVRELRTNNKHNALFG